MIKHVYLFGMLLIMLVSILAGCSPSEEEALASVEEIANASFEQEALDANQTFDNFSIYIPSGFEVTEESQSNLILEQGSQTYILFYNALENSTSKLNYQAAEANGNHQLLESFENEDRFGYVKVTKLEKDYELQVGIGGVKITTQSSLSNMEEDTEAMMQMANSIAYTDQSE